MSNVELEVFKNDVFPDRVAAADIQVGMSDDEVAELSPPLGLVNDIRVSTYGAIGFTLLDSAPENRISTWESESDYCGLEGSDFNSDVSAGFYPADFARDSRINGTRFGFKIIRYAILPQPLLDRLGTNKWVGPAVIRQALEDGVVPAEYAERAVAPSNAIQVHSRSLRIEDKTPERQYKGKLMVLESILKQLDDTIDFGDHEVDFTDARFAFNGIPIPPTHRTYESFHPWVYFGNVQKRYAEGVDRMLANIDELMDQFVDRDGQQLEEVRRGLAKDKRYLQVARVGLTGAEVEIAEPQQ